MDKCFIAGSRATWTLNYSFPFPYFITRYNRNYLPIYLFHYCKNWCLLIQWLVRAHFYSQLKRSLCLGNQIIISAGFPISSADTWVCDQNAQYVIRLEDGTPLFQRCSQASEDECWMRNRHFRGLLSSGLLSLICVTLDKSHLSNATISFPMKPQGWIGLSVGSLLEGSQRIYWQSCGNLWLWKTSIWLGYWGAQWREGDLVASGCLFWLLSSLKLAGDGERERE